MFACDPGEHRPWLGDLCGMTSGTKHQAWLHMTSHMQIGFSRRDRGKDLFRFNLGATMWHGLGAVLCMAWVRLGSISSELSALELAKRREDTSHLPLRYPLFAPACRSRNPEPSPPRRAGRGGPHLLVPAQTLPLVAWDESLVTPSCSELTRYPSRLPFLSIGLSPLIMASEDLLLCHAPPVSMPLCRSGWEPQHLAQG